VVFKLPGPGLQRERAGSNRREPRSFPSSSESPRASEHVLVRRGADPSRRCVASPKNHLQDEAKESHQAGNQAENKELHELRRAGRTGRRSRAQNTRDSRNWRSSLDEQQARAEQPAQLSFDEPSTKSEPPLFRTKPEPKKRTEPSRTRRPAEKPSRSKKLSKKPPLTRAKQKQEAYCTTTTNKAEDLFLILLRPSPAPGVTHPLVPAQPRVGGSCLRHESRDGRALLPLPRRGGGSASFVL